MTLGSLLSLMRLTLTSPREGAHAVLSLGLPVPVLWMIVVLLSALSTILTVAGEALAPAGGLMGGPMMDMPLAAAGLQLVVTGIMVALSHRVGVWCGGTGRFEDAFHLVVWLQAILVAVQVVQIVLLPILPPVASLLGLLALGLFFYLLTQFLMVIHGFENPGLTFVMILVTIVGAIMLLSILLTLLGVAPLPSASGGFGGL